MLEFLLFCILLVLLIREGWLFRVLGVLFKIGCVLLLASGVLFYVCIKVME